MKPESPHRPLTTKIQLAIYNIAFVLEVIVAIAVVALILLKVFYMAIDMKNALFDGSMSTEFEHYLEQALTVVIGIEFLKMLCRHNMRSVVEVLLFTLARHLIIDVHKMMDALLCVAAIALLFVVRKYLFIPEIDNLKSDHRVDHHHHEEHHFFPFGHHKEEKKAEENETANV